MATSFALTEPRIREARRRTWLRRLGAVAAAVATAWLTGFGWFLYLGARDIAPPPHADAIVVLTGGPERVDVALRLLSTGAADRLLVSGAGEKTDLADLAHLSGLDPAPLAPQITLGHAARTTRGNALETASWAQAEQVRTLLVVTTWFHMPRALVELRRAMPALTLLPYPVGQLRTEELFHAGGVRRLIGEYHKYLAALSGLTASPMVVAVLGSEPVR
ncbi:MAG: YdcF family protein [Acetobacteraceae bacterium]|jgi:uncharacterized SAM-binding protein YcdF (DUF218 family)